MSVENKFLEATFYFDYNSEGIQKHLKKVINVQKGVQEKLVAWYLYVRDNWAYDPYTIFLSPEKYKASSIIKRNEAHCIDKTTVFVTGLRAMGIPSRIRLAKVKNHISAERIIEKLGTDELAPHGYAEVYFNEKWTKASPIFDANLCRFLNVDTLAYNGMKDSVFQEFDKEGGRFMEYLEDYGPFADLPFERIKEIMAMEYPKFALEIIKSGADVLKFKEKKED